MLHAHPSHPPWHDNLSIINLNPIQQLQRSSGWHHFWVVQDTNLCPQNQLSVVSSVFQTNVKFVSYILPRPLSSTDLPYTLFTQHPTIRIGATESVIKSIQIKPLITHIFYSFLLLPQTPFGLNNFSCNMFLKHPLSSTFGNAFLLFTP